MTKESPTRAKQLGERVKKLRENKGWSQADLAKACGWTQSRIGNYESGRNGMAIDVIAEIAKALGVPDYEIIITDEAHRSALADSNPSDLESMQKAFEENKQRFTGLVGFAGTPISKITVEMSGNSMEGSDPKRCIPSGSKLTVETDITNTELNGKVVYVKVGDSEVPIIKELQIDGPNTYLVPWNSRYEVIKVTDDYEIIGYVTEIRISL